MENDNRTEGTMSTITSTPRYGYSPGVAFAATRAFAERRALAIVENPADVAPAARSTRRLARWLSRRLPGAGS